MTGDSNVTFVCTPCEAGYYSNVVTSRNCTICAPGSFAGRGQAECTLCPVGSYGSVPGMEACTKCPGRRITPSLGSISIDVCVSPVSNYVIGSVTWSISVGIIVWYIMCGKLHHIAFKRKMTVDQQIIQFNFLNNELNLLNKELKQITVKEDEVGVISITRQYRSKNMDGWITFALATIVVPFVTVFLFLVTFMRSVFNSLILFRGFSFVFTVPFVDLLKHFLGDILSVLHLNELQYVAYPIYALMDILANFTFIKLDAVNVTCPGAIAPTRMLLNLLIMTFAIELIESDLELFWLTTISSVRTNVWDLFATKSFFKNNKGVSLLVILSTLLMSVVPKPTKNLQYILSLVTVSLFVENEGVSSHSETCNAAIGKFPADTILAYITTIVFYVAIIPLIYIMSQVVIPSFYLLKSSVIANNGSKRRRKKWLIGIGDLISLDTVFISISKVYENVLSLLFRRNKKLSILASNNRIMVSNWMENRTANINLMRLGRIQPVSVDRVHDTNHPDTCIEEWNIEHNSNDPFHHLEAYVPSYIETVRGAQAQSYFEVVCALFLISKMRTTVIRSHRQAHTITPTGPGYTATDEVQMIVSPMKRHAIWQEICVRYFVFVCVCFGIYTPFTVKRFHLLKVIHVMKRTANRRYVDTEHRDPFSDETSENKSFVTNVLFSVVGVRAVLLLLIPYFQPFALLALNTLSCPMYVTDKHLKGMLYDGFFSGSLSTCFHEARIAARHRVSVKGESYFDWELNCIALNIIVNESRYIQFATNAMIMLYSALILLSSTASDSVLFRVGVAFGGLILVALSSIGATALFIVARKLVYHLPKEDVDDDSIHTQHHQPKVHPGKHKQEHVSRELDLESPKGSSMKTFPIPSHRYLNDTATSSELVLDLSLTDAMKSDDMRLASTVDEYKSKPETSILQIPVSPYRYPSPNETLPSHTPVNTRAIPVKIASSHSKLDLTIDFDLSDDADDDAADDGDNVDMTFAGSYDDSEEGTYDNINNNNNNNNNINYNINYNRNNNIYNDNNDDDNDAIFHGTDEQSITSSVFDGLPVGMVSMVGPDGEFDDDDVDDDVDGEEEEEDESMSTETIVFSIEGAVHGSGQDDGHAVT